MLEVSVHSRHKKTPVSFLTREVTRHMSTKWKRVEPTTHSRKGGKNDTGFLMAVKRNIITSPMARQPKRLVKKVF